MTETARLETELTSTSAALHAATGDNFSLYQRLLESFLCGRMTKEELESALRRVLCDDLTKYDLHNKYIGLVLEKLAAVESIAIQQCQTSETAHIESALLDLDTIQFTPADRDFFQKASSNQEAPSTPYEAEDVTLQERFLHELSGAEKSVGKPLLCRISGTLLDATAIKALLATWSRTFDLETSSIEDEHVSLVSQGLEDYLGYLVERAKRRILDEGAELRMDAFRDAASTSHLPATLKDQL